MYIRYNKHKHLFFYVIVTFYCFLFSSLFYVANVWIVAVKESRSTSIGALTPQPALPPLLGRLQDHLRLRCRLFAARPLEIPRLLALDAHPPGALQASEGHEHVEEISVEWRSQMLWGRGCGACQQKSCWRGCRDTCAPLCPAVAHPHKGSTLDCE